VVLQAGHLSSCAALRSHCVAWRWLNSRSGLRVLELSLRPPFLQFVLDASLHQWITAVADRDKDIRLCSLLSYKLLGAAKAVGICVFEYKRLLD